MSTINLSDFKALFLSTSREQLEKLRSGIADLDKNPHNIQARDAVYINAHTLASKNMMMGYKTTGALCKTIELIFYAQKENHLTLSPELLQLLSEATENIADSLAMIEEQNHEKDLTTIDQSLISMTGVQREA